VVRLNDIHNHSTFRGVYAKFSRIFIDSFCLYRRNTNVTGLAINFARKEVEKSFFKELKSHRNNTKMVLVAYQRICNDSELVEKAISYYKGMEKAK
jgi:hypothetical protein